MDSLRDELNAYDTSAQGATIRFSLDKPLPAAVVKKIVRVRMQEIDARKK
jgi:hypothetical protein